MNDRKLPGLGRAVNDEDMRTLLSRALAKGQQGTKEALPQVRHRVLKHRPGKRCVIEYRIESSGDPEVQRVIGKLYRKSRGARIFKNMEALWSAARTCLHGAPVFTMSEPLAYLPELDMVLQNPVPGRQLSSFTESDDLSGAIRAVAENLSALHGLSVAAGEKKTIGDHVEKFCHPGPEALMEACPDVAPLVNDIVSGLARDDSLAGAPVCPVHGDLGLTQIFVAGDRAFFIDFDGFCLSHPALDVANFLIAVEVHHRAQSDNLAGIFFDAYFDTQEQQALTGLGTYQALIHLRRAMICLRSKPSAAWRQQVRDLLETGSRYL